MSPVQIRDPRLMPGVRTVPYTRCLTCGNPVQGTPVRNGTWWAFCRRCGWAVDVAKVRREEGGVHAA